MQEGTDHLGYADRVDVNTVKEHLAVGCLNLHLAEKGQKLLISTEYENQIEKIDAFLTDLSGDKADKSRPLAVKVRESLDDILVCHREPWYGPGDPRSKLGRDMCLVYHWYVSMNRAKTTLRIVNGEVVHRIIEDLWDEWVHKKIDERPDIWVLSSTTHPGCQLRLHTDKKNSMRKILGFVPPSYLKKDDIFCIPYDVTKEEVYAGEALSAQPAVPKSSETAA